MNWTRTGSGRALATVARRSACSTEIVGYTRGSPTGPAVLFAAELAYTRRHVHHRWDAAADHHDFGRGTYRYWLAFECSRLEKLIA
jgi:hypothetical protein